MTSYGTEQAMPMTERGTEQKTQRTWEEGRNGAADAAASFMGQITPEVATTK